MFISSFKSRTSASMQIIVLMYSIIFLLNLNFTILRSVRNTLAVADLGGSARSIPHFELFGVLPAAFFMTWLLSYLLRIFSLRNVFLLILVFFIIFYALFATLCYPVLRAWHEQAGNGSLYGHSKILKACTMLFYVLGELWKPALIQILFWGLINLNLPLIQAKRIYPFLMLGASLGSIVAGPTIIGCTSLKVWQWLPISSNHWSHSFILMMLLVCFVGVVTGLLYYRLSSFFEIAKPMERLPQGDSISLKQSILACLQSSSLGWMCWIVVADYIAYSLGEVIFLEVLKHQFPAPADYCRYMGYLAFWSSTLTLISAMLFAPFCVRKCRWVTLALILPIALLIIEGAFFIFLRIESVSSSLFAWSHSEWVACVVWLGSCQYCACRAIKYTFFDTAKELAFASLPKNKQIQGKLVVDGICARLGRGGASALTLSFISCAGGVLASSAIAGITSFAISFSWVVATQRLGKKMDAEEVLHA